MSTRIANWPTVLADFIESRRAVPFVWGKNDCCLFASDWIKTLVGKDPARVLKLRGKYKDPLAAARLLKRFGGCEGIAAKYAKKMGWQEISPLGAQRGDLVSAAMPDGIALGICVGYRCAFAGRNGLVFQLTGTCRKAWRIT